MKYIENMDFIALNYKYTILIFTIILLILSLKINKIINSMVLHMKY